MLNMAFQVSGDLRPWEEGPCVCILVWGSILKRSIGHWLPRELGKRSKQSSSIGKGTASALMILLAVLKASFSSKGSVGMTTAHPHLPLRTQPFTRLSHQRGLRLSTGLLQAHFPFLPDCLEACGTAAISWVTSMNCRLNDIRGTEKFNSVQSLSLVRLFATP